SSRAASHGPPGVSSSHVTRPCSSTSTTFCALLHSTSVLPLSMRCTLIGPPGTAMRARSFPSAPYSTTRLDEYIATSRPPLDKPWHAHGHPPDSATANVC